MIKVAITDDQVIILNGMQKILATDSSIELTGLYRNGDELLLGLENEVPDVLLLDIQMPDKSGIEIAGIVSKKFPGIKIIALTNIDIIPQVKKMLSQGCMGYLLKDADSEVIFDAIQTVMKDEQYLHEPVKKALLQALTGRKKKILLTRREKEILVLIVDGLSNKEIAAKLNLSVRTVENHRNHLLQKFDVKNTAGLVKIAIEEGLTNA
jgi:DNA-binding NarL/FixJ family response regulator